MCIACEINAERKDQFAERLLEILNDSMLSLMISVGHRVGLFDTMADLPPSTSSKIADAAGLNERYVREWLGALTVGRIVECESGNGAGPKYHLPPEHAASLTRANPRDNMAVFSQYTAVLGGVEDEIVRCFRRGGGVPYESYKRFHEVMAEDSGQGVVSSLLTDILPLIPGIQEKLEQDAEVMDVGCGQGRALNLLAKTYPNSRFQGFDLCKEPIAVARGVAAGQGLRNARFNQRDLTTFDIDGPADHYDLITAFDAIHDQNRPDRLLAGIHRALKPGGNFLMVDIQGSSDHLGNMDHPLGPTIYTISCMHCMTVSLSQGGMGLGAAWGEQKAQAMLKEVGFEIEAVHHFDYDPQNCYTIAKKNGE